MPAKTVAPNSTVRSAAVAIATALAFGCLVFMVTTTTTTTTTKTATIMTTAQPLGHRAGRQLNLINRSGKKVAVDWVDPETGDAVNMAPGAAPGQMMTFQSYVNHSFVVRLLSDDEKKNATKSVTVTVEAGDDYEQVVMLKENLQVERVHLHDTEEEEEVPYEPEEREDDGPLLPGRYARGLSSEATRAAAHELVGRCRRAAKAQLAVGRAFDAVATALADCMTEQAAVAIADLHEELGFQNSLLKSISAMAENYTCADPTKTTTEPKEYRTWEYEGVERTVGILHDRQASQIHVIKQFISPEECQAIVEAAAPTLHRGTVADGKGGSRLSENRKAWQAGVHHDPDNENDPILAVKKRLFAYANHVTGFGMELPGQEEIMSIQYFGDGTDNPTPDRYTPHCDGDCNGLPHKRGGRVATMVMYCDVPELGGATNFQNANVYVKPEVGAAAFFSYMDPVTGNHEDGFTSHSGCPVLLGTKRIAVQWLRVGVDEENPWDSFDTNTVSKKVLSAIN